MLRSPDAKARAFGTRAGPYYAVDQTLSKGICATDGTGSETVQQCVVHGGRCLPALRRIFCKRAVDDLANSRGQVRRALAQGHGGLFEDGPNRVVHTRFVGEVES